MKYKGFRLRQEALKMLDLVQEDDDPYWDGVKQLCLGAPDSICDDAPCRGCLFAGSSIPDYDYRKRLIRELCKMLGKETKL